MDKILHVYGQDAHHDDAYIVMTKDVARKLRNNIALLVAVMESECKDKVSLLDDFFVNDGEGFTLRLCIVDDATAEKLSTPYTADYISQSDDAINPWDI
jgi:hypothetical protein